MISNDEFELIYNINPGPKFFFGELKIKFPSDYDLNYYDEVISFLNEVQDKPYSISTVEEILEKIEKITLNDQFKSIKATLDEKHEIYTGGKEILMVKVKRFLPRLFYKILRKQSGT